MRLWTFHPLYLDAKGLVALWREGLLAQKVLQGNTRGYRNHPQLDRFKESGEPLSLIGKYLCAVQEEATTRGYHFDYSKISKMMEVEIIRETEGQLLYEWRHYLAKLKARAPGLYAKHKQVICPKPNPLFVIVPGPVRKWEKVINVYEKRPNLPLCR